MRYGYLHARPAKCLIAMYGKKLAGDGQVVSFKTERRESIHIAAGNLCTDSDPGQKCQERDFEDIDDGS